MDTNSIFGGLLSTGSSVFTGITNAQTAKENAKAAQAAQKAAATNAAVTQQSNKMKYTLIAVGLVLAGVVAFFILKKK